MSVTFPSFRESEPERKRFKNFVPIFQDWEEKTLKCYCKSGKRCNLSKEKFDLGKPPRGAKGRIRCKSVHCWNYEAEWVEPEFVQYREVTEWPHLNECVKSLEVGGGY